MTTVRRTSSTTNPTYKDYVNFLHSYKNGNKDDRSDYSNPPSVLSTPTTPIIASDVPDFAKKPNIVSYNNYLENAKNKKFSPVKAQPNAQNDISKDSKISNVDKVENQKNEIFIEIQPTKTVSEVSRMFETKQSKKPPTRTDKISSKLSIFEKQSSVEHKPKIFKNKLQSPPPKLVLQPLPPTNAKTTAEKTKTLPPNAEQSQDIPKPPPMVELVEKPKSPPPTLEKTEIEAVLASPNAPPPPPLPPLIVNNGPPKAQATLQNAPQIKYSVTSNTEGNVPTTIDKNDPQVKKLVYSHMRQLYGSYHEKANDMMSTLPKDRVKKSNGVQDIIDKIASSGDLEKLNGRINPKVDQE